VRSEINNILNKQTLRKFSPVGTSGPAEAYQPQQEGFAGEFCKNKQLSFFRVIKSISLKKLSFFFIFTFCCS